MLPQRHRQQPAHQHNVSRPAQGPWAQPRQLSFTGLTRFWSRLITRQSLTIQSASGLALTCPTGAGHLASSSWRAQTGSGGRTTLATTSSRPSVRPSARNRKMFLLFLLYVLTEAMGPC